MKHALTWKNDIKAVLEMSEQVDLEVAVKIKREDSVNWELVRADMVFENEKAAKKHVFMAKLKGKK